MAPARRGTLRSGARCDPGLGGISSGEACIAEVYFTTYFRGGHAPVGDAVPVGLAGC
jgi:hypothetical protein